VSVCIVTTCMGRLGYLERSLPTWIMRTPFPIVVVDYDCPQCCGDWVEQTAVLGAIQGKLHVVRSGSVPQWNASHARNLGKAAAIELFRPKSLLFLDCDDFITDELDLSQLRRISESGQFGICNQQPELDGVLLAPTEAVGWFVDECTNSYEVIDRKFHLRIRKELKYETMNGFGSIEHTDDLRGIYLLRDLSEEREVAWNWMQDRWGRLPLADGEIRDLMCRKASNE
jgi:hypothetical protein